MTIVKKASVILPSSTFVRCETTLARMRLKSFAVALALLVASTPSSLEAAKVDKSSPQQVEIPPTPDGIERALRPALRELTRQTAGVSIEPELEKALKRIEANLDAALGYWRQALEEENQAAKRRKLRLARLELRAIPLGLSLFSGDVALAEHRRVIRSERSEQLMKTSRNLRARLLRALQRL